MPLEVDFIETFQSGASTSEAFDTVTLEVRVGVNFVAGVTSYDITNLSFNSATADFFSISQGPGFSIVPNGSPGTLNFSGIFTDLNSSAGAGAVMATIVFHLTSGATTVPLFGITGNLNSDPESSHADVPCFAAGTLIRTRRGDVPVETLREGDEVMTLLGGRWARLVWLGHRRVNCARHPRPHDVMPVRVARDTFAPGIPARDVLLSPDHALHVDGGLIPVRYLLNGATVTQETVAQISYFHVELERHDVLLAEGMPAESYLDTGNRIAFANGGKGVMAHPDFALRTWQTKSCAPLVYEGPSLNAARASLLARAAQLGHTTTADANAMLLVGGRPLLPRIVGTTLHFQLPPDARDIRLSSRAAIPAQREISSGDHRRLGIAIAGITVDGQGVRLDDPRLTTGWHQPEAGWRWTDGEAAIAAPGTKTIEIRLALTTTYWTNQAARTDRAA